jgi:hypothetical protein
VGRGLKGKVVTQADDQVRIAVFGILQVLNVLFVYTQLPGQFLEGDFFPVNFFDDAHRIFADVAFLVEKTLELFMLEL